MVIIEIAVYVCLASLTGLFLNILNRAQIAKWSDFIYFGVLLSLIIAQLLISLQIDGSVHPTTYICFGVLFALILIYFLIRITVSSSDIRENAWIWIGWTMFLVLGVSFCLLLELFVDPKVLPNTKTALLSTLFRMPIALALCIGMAYYPSAFDRLTAPKTDTEQTTTDGDTEAPTEPTIEEHKDAIIKLATESWYFTTVYQRMLTNVDVSQHRKYTSQLRWFVRKMEEALEESGLRIVNVEDQSYDPSMAVSPVNLEDFHADVPLVVNQMLEPIIMDGTTLVKMGKVTLKEK